MPIAFKIDYQNQKNILSTKTFGIVGCIIYKVAGISCLDKYSGRLISPHVVACELRSPTWRIPGKYPRQTKRASQGSFCLWYNTKMTKSKLYFHGGAGFVTGANFVLEVANKKIMLDCGLIQGGDYALKLNRKSFTYNPSEIDVLFVSHAHMDHIGRIPKLVADGFKGKIYSTKPTKDMAPIMYDDALKIMRSDKETKGIEPFYDLKDAEKAVSMWEGVEYGQEISVGNGITVSFKNAGHILGSAMIEVKRDRRKLIYTGDLGNPPEPLLPDRDKIEEANYLVIESVYGNRSHENRNDRVKILKSVIQEAKAKNKTVIIPTFSLERTQVLLLEINNMFESGEVSPLPVYLDSPLANKLTDVFRRYTHWLKDEVQKQIQAGDDIFDFPRFKEIKTARESKEMLDNRDAKIILAGSGMSTGGRVIMHEKTLLEDKNTVILFVGYQGVGTLGRQIQEGNKKVEIEGEMVRVKAKVVSISGFSAHADKDELLEAVSESQDTLKEVFVALGDGASSLFFAQRIYEYLGIKSRVPQNGDMVEIEF